MEVLEHNHIAEVHMDGCPACARRRIMSAVELDGVRESYSEPESKADHNHNSLAYMPDCPACNPSAATYTSVETGQGKPLPRTTATVEGDDHYSEIDIKEEEVGNQRPLSPTEISWSQHNYTTDTRLPTTIEAAFHQVAGEIIQTLITRGQKYGRDNITRSGIHGILTRLGDKLARLDNDHTDCSFRTCTNIRSLPDEAQDDGWIDLAGYSLIALLLQRGWWELPNQTPKSNWQCGKCA